MSDRAITLETIEAAEKLLGVRYTPAEPQLMQDNLEGQIESARARRVLTLANNVPMASRFDPRLPGFAAPPPQRPSHGKLITGETAADATQFEVPQGMSLWAGLFDEGRSATSAWRWRRSSASQNGGRPWRKRARATHRSRGPNPPLGAHMTGDPMAGTELA